MLFLCGNSLMVSELYDILLQKLNKIKFLQKYFLMKVSISYPPIINKIGQKAMVSQNRNVQYFSVPTYLLGVTHAQAATMLKNDGIEVIWDDGNAQLKNLVNGFKIYRAKSRHNSSRTTTPIMNIM